MIKTFQHPEKSWRIAVVWMYDSMISQHCLKGLYHRADRFPEVCLQKFNAEAADFRREVLDPLRQWRPHGLVVRIGREERLQQLRRQFPDLPFVSTVMASPDLVNTVVAGHTINSITMIRDYFHKCGLSHVVLFSIAADCAITKISDAFDGVVPGGYKILCPQKFFESRTPAARKRQHQIMTDGLRALPKPVGVLTLETQAAPFLLKWCQKLGLRVPEEVQIIGLDEEDLCLACEPRLTSYVLPSEQIGGSALETMLCLLRQEKPAPPPIVRIFGGVIIPRGSTAMLKVGQHAVTGSIDRIQAQAARGLTAGDVTRLSKVGRTTFYKQFGAITNNTPGRYLRKMRLDEACRRLQETNDTVTAVGKVCGFKSLQSFVNFFRRQTGRTPTEYRNQRNRSSKDRLKS